MGFQMPGIDDSEYAIFFFMIGGGGGGGGGDGGQGHI